MKDKSNIALVGFRASGKSLIGRLLARQDDRSFVDMDERLIASFGRDIDQWVRSEGWESFRQAESRLLEELARKQNLVVATGGGVVLSARNRRLLKTHFHVVWLKASVETTCARLQSDPQTVGNRPALTSLPLREEIQQTLAARWSLYEEVADLVLETDDLDPADLVSRLLARLRSNRQGDSEARAFPRR